jgi:putative flavoprotein involved in K+ transport
VNIHPIIIIGAGPAGLAMSYQLRRRNLTHLILEAGRLGESWRNRRWDSLHLVAPNWHLQLPGMPYAGPDPDGFLQRDAVVAYLEAYAALVDPPLRTGVHVTALESATDRRGYLLQSSVGVMHAEQVVIATGAYTTPRLPDCATRVAPAITQIHAMEYQRPEQLPPGSVLVVGSGESGCQIAEELRRSGRVVWLAVGRCGWLPRRYRGRDCIAWVTAMGGFEQTVDNLPNGDPRNAPPGPQLTGADGGRDLNLHTLARNGVHLVGRLEAVENGSAYFAQDLAARITESDAGMQEFCLAVDRFITTNGLEAPSEPPPQYMQAYDAAPSAPTALDLAQAGITGIVWATGYRPQFAWVRLPVCAPDGYPIHSRGLTAMPGLYFLGLEWQYKARSHVFQGLGDDAGYLADQIARMFYGT